MAVSTLAVSLLATILLLLIFMVGTITTTSFNPLRHIPGLWHNAHNLHAKYGPMVRISPIDIAVNDAEAFHEINHTGSSFNKVSMVPSVCRYQAPKHVYHDRPQATCSATKAFCACIQQRFPEAALRQAGKGKGRFSDEQDEE